MSLASQIQILATRIATEFKSVRSALSAKASSGANTDITSLSALTSDLRIDKGWASLQVGNGNYRWEMISNGIGTSDLPQFSIMGTTDGFKASFITGLNISADGTVSFGKSLPISQGGTGANTADAARLALGGGTYPLVNGGNSPGDIIVKSVGLTSSGYPYVSYTDGNNSTALKVLTEQSRSLLSGGYGVLNEVGTSRALNTMYINSTGRPITVLVSVRILSSSWVSFRISTMGDIATTDFSGVSLSQAIVPFAVIVPANVGYGVFVNDPTLAEIYKWNEG